MKQNSIIALYFTLLIFIFQNVYSQTWNWAKTYSSTISDYGQSIGTDQWGNVYIKGRKDAYAPGPAGGAFIYHFLLKYTAAGNLLWMKTITAQGDLAKTDINGNTFIVGGNIITKYDSSGTQLWVKTIPNRNFTELALAPSGGIVVSGSIPLVSCGSAMTIHMLDTNGDEVWNRSNDLPTCSSLVTCDKLGNTYAFAFAGLQNNNVVSHKLLKIDVSGNLTAIISIPQFTFSPYGQSLTVANDLSIYISATYSYFNNLTTTVAKYDQQGNNMWTNYIIGGWGQIIAGKDNNAYILTGSRNSLQYQSTVFTGSVSLVVIKLDTAGTIMWSKQTTGKTNLGGSAISISDANEIYITGNITGTHYLDSIIITGGAYQDIFVAKLSSPALTNSLKEQKKNEELFSISPNPSHGLFLIKSGHLTKGDVKLSVLNSMGQQIFIENNRHTGNAYLKEVDLSGLAKGIYFIELINDTQKTVKKIVLE